MWQHLSHLGSLPNPAAETHSHYKSRPILAHELEEATYNSNDLHVGSSAERADKQQPPPHCSAHRYAISGSQSSVLPQGVEYKGVGRVEGGGSRDFSLMTYSGEEAGGNSSWNYEQAWTV